MRITDEMLKRNPRLAAAVRAAEAKHDSARTAPVIVPAQVSAGKQEGKRRNKYGAVKVKVQGERTFDSKWEHALWLKLRLEWEDGKTRWVWRQFQIPLPGNITMRIDFALVEQVEGCFVVRRLIDAKGMQPTRDWINKRKQAECIYGIAIEERRR